MGPHAVDYASMPLNAALELIKHKPLSKQAKEALSTMMKSNWGTMNKKTGKFEFPAVPDFPGMDKITPEWIAANRAAGKKLVKLMDTKKIADLGDTDMDRAKGRHRSAPARRPDGNHWAQHRQGRPGGRAAHRRPQDTPRKLCQPIGRRRVCGGYGRHPAGRVLERLDRRPARQARRWTAPCIPSGASRWCSARHRNG